MLIALDPNATWDFIPPDQGDAQAPIRIECRYLSMRASNRFSSEAERVLAAAISGAGMEQSAAAALRMVVVRVHGLPEGLEGVDGLLEVATALQVLIWMRLLAKGQTIAEGARKNSARRQPGSPASSAASAAPDDASRTSPPASSAPSAAGTAAEAATAPATTS